MVRTKNLHIKKRGRPRKNKLFLNHLQHKNFLVTDGSLVNLSLRYGKFTSCDITVRETSVDNKVLRVPLERYDFTALRNISSDLNLSSIRRGIKRKQNSSFVSNQRSQKRIRINGCSNLNNSKNNLSNNPTDVITNQMSNKSKDFYKNSTSKTFDKSKFKIRLGSKFTNKKSQKRLLKNSTITQKELIKKKDNVATENTTSKAIDGTFYLKFKRDLPITNGKFNYKFQKLISDVKNMTLPAATWKIKVIIRQNKISAITFTNKKELERSVTFSSEAESYKLVIDKKVALLLGSPNTIDNPEDIEILLDIIEHLNSDSPIILYR